MGKRKHKTTIKIGLILMLLLGIYGHSEAGFNPFKIVASIFGGGGGLKIDTSKKNTQIKDTKVASDNKITVSMLKDFGKKFGEKLDKLVDIQIENKATLKAVDNTVNGNVTITNDPKMLKYFISVLGMIILTLIRGNFAERKHRRSLEQSKEKWKNKMLEMLIKDKIEDQPVG